MFRLNFWAFNKSPPYRRRLSPMATLAMCNVMELSHEELRETLRASELTLRIHVTNYYFYMHHKNVQILTEFFFNLVLCIVTLEI